eukprot:SAG31_NODE_2666_length_5273_cov_2.404716_5_plen_101_part_00
MALALGSRRRPVYSFTMRCRYGEAVAAYSRALDVTYGASAVDSTDPAALASAKATLYCNRAMCHLQLDNWQLAEADASSCLDFDPQVCIWQRSKIRSAVS